MTTSNRMRFGVFLAPFHRLGEHPTVALERDMRLVEHLDVLGFDEVWVGEHHSAGWEIISSPEVFLAAAAMRTRRIRLGTGVVSLPYHNPLMVADRIVLVDHLSRGRAMLGVGPGALPSDASMMGIDAARQRDMMDEALGVILRLLDGETVTHDAGWFKLHEARLQLSACQERIPVAVASTFSPAGMKTAGRYGVGVLSLGTFVPGGLVNAAEQWKIAEIYASDQGKTFDRDTWNIVLPAYIAPTREQAQTEAAEHIRGWVDYFGYAMGRPLPIPADATDLQVVEFLTKAGVAIIGTPEDAVDAIHAMIELSGGFGGLLFLAHEWTSSENINRSYELLARYVIPEFTGATKRLRASMDWVHRNYGQIESRAASAFTTAVADHNAYLAGRGDRK
jgi:limonene 1,2-monooxygenase